MSKQVVSFLGTLADHLDCLAGESVCQLVMQGSEKITDATRLERVARWTQGAMARLDALVDEQTRERIMSGRGRHCAQQNVRSAEKVRARRRASGSLDEFLDAEVRMASPGTHLVREGNTLYQSYTPGAYRIRCYCPLLRKLPDGETVSMTYCQCSQAFVRWNWEYILEQPVDVVLLESCVCGGDECKFVIRLGAGSR
jgi:hypothetical protein